MKCRIQLIKTLIKFKKNIDFVWLFIGHIGHHGVFYKCQYKYRDASWKYNSRNFIWWTGDLSTVSTHTWFQSRNTVLFFVNYISRALSMSDNLSKLAQKIDFSKVDEDTKQPEIEIKNEEESREQSPNVPVSGWIDSVVSKLK